MWQLQGMSKPGIKSVQRAHSARRLGRLEAQGWEPGGTSFVDRYARLTTALPSRARREAHWFVEWHADHSCEGLHHSSL